MVQMDTVVFNGWTFIRFPLAKSRSARVYYTAYANGRRAKNIGQLHVEVWKAANGKDEVPPGHVVHHADLDPLNNDPANLVCVTRKEHAQLHEAGRDHDSPEWLAHLASIRPLAARWHRSEEGRDWHRRNSQAIWQGWERYTRACDQCGSEYEAAFARSRYCSSACNQRANRAEGRYKQEAICEVCGTAFMQNKYQPSRSCSRSCAAKLRRRRRTP